MMTEAIIRDISIFQIGFFSKTELFQPIKGSNHSFAYTVELTFSLLAIEALESSYTFVTVITRLRKISKTLLFKLWKTLASIFINFN